MKYYGIVFFTLSLLCDVGFVSSQLAGTATPEVHPPLTTYSCTSSGCIAQAQAIVIDANWRWIHENTSSMSNCFTGSSWDSTICPDPITCAANCAVDGALYSATYGITTTGSSLSLQLVTGSNVGSRVYLMDTESKYQVFNLKNREFTFTVDVSSLPCGLNGALYFVEMDSDGGTSRFPSNSAGAKYGTGYCDAQCPHDVKFINGQANSINWDAGSGGGQFGSCCIELDIWEANKMSAAFTPHPCTITGQYRCNGTECGAGSERYEGICDKDGCDFNSYRMGDTTFYGPSQTIDTTQPITVITQFLTDTGDDDGVLSEMRRVYVQNGKVVPNSMATWSGLTTYDSITDTMCAAAKTLFGDTDDFTPKGGMKSIGGALDRGMVLVMSLWTDTSSNMLWLDSNDPADGDATTPGVARGSCAVTSGNSATIVSTDPTSTVVFSDVSWGPIGSTTAGVTSVTTPASTPVVTAPANKATTTPTTAPTTVTPTPATNAPKTTSPTPSTTPATTTTPTTTPKTTTSAGSCTVSVTENLDATWPNDSGLVKLTITNTGTLPVTSVQLSLTVTGTISSFFCLETASSMSTNNGNNNNVYVLPGWALPLSVGTSFSESGIVFNNGRPSIVATALCS